MAARGLRRSGDDAFKLTVDYLKQEALEPLKGLGRFLALGLAGSLAIAVGILLLLVGILRLLQTETGTALTGDWSWVPYFAVSAARCRRGRRGRLAHHGRAGASKAARGSARARATRPESHRATGQEGEGRKQLMPRPGTNGRRITREDLQAAYSQVMGEGEATARAAAPQGSGRRRRGRPGPRHPGLPGRPPAGRSRSAVVEIRRL
jgi:hypothetical protein